MMVILVECDCVHSVRCDSISWREGAGRDLDAGDLWTVEVSLRLGGWNRWSSPPSRSKISFAILMAAPSRMAFCCSQNISIDLKKNTIETKKVLIERLPFGNSLLSPIDFYLLRSIDPVPRLLTTFASPNGAHPRVVEGCLLRRSLQGLQGLQAFNLGLVLPREQAQQQEGRQASPATRSQVQSAYRPGEPEAEEEESLHRGRA